MYNYRIYGMHTHSCHSLIHPLSISSLFYVIINLNDFIMLSIITSNCHALCMSVILKKDSISYLLSRFLFAFIIKQEYASSMLFTNTHVIRKNEKIK